MSDIPDRVEAVARAICLAGGGKPDMLVTYKFAGQPIGDLGRPQPVPEWRVFVRAAEAAIAADKAYQESAK